VENFKNINQVGPIDIQEFSGPNHNAIEIVFVESNKNDWPRGYDSKAFL